MGRCIIFVCISVDIFRRLDISYNFIRINISSVDIFCRLDILYILIRINISGGCNF